MILTNDGYKITQHDADHSVIVFKDNKIVAKIKASRPMKDSELLDTFKFLRDSTYELERKSCRGETNDSKRVFTAIQSRR